MNFADDVAYSIHDAEDFYRAGLIPLETLVDGSVETDRLVGRVAQNSEHSEAELVFAWESAAPFAVERRYTGTAAQRAALREWTSSMIQRYLQAVKVTPDEQRKLSIPTNIQQEIELLKALTWEYVIDNPKLATQQMGHRKIIQGLFEAYLDAFSEHPHVLPARFRHYIEGDLASEIYGSTNENQRKIRTIADIVSSMTDLEALRMYQRLHGFLPGSLSDIPPM